MSDVDALPVTVLTGFLGAGKTTLLKRLMAAPHGRRIGVILNEFGQTGIDEVEGAARQKTIELANGCVCCLRSPDLMAALREMKARGDVDLVIVETSGLADPLALTWMIGRPDLADVARLDAVVTVVDAVAWDRARTTEEWQAQIRCADLIVLAKTDLGGDRAALETAVAEAGGGARIVDGGAELPIELLLDVSPDPGAVAERASGRPEAKHSGFHAVSLADASGVFDSDRVEDFVEALPEAVFRAKGVVRVAANRWARFHAVGGRVDFDPDAPAPAHGETRVVFLGPHLGEGELRPLWEACRMPLRADQGPNV